MTTIEDVSTETVRSYLLALQERLCVAYEALDGEATFLGSDRVTPGGAEARPRVLENGAVLERAAAHFSYNRGGRLPSAATDRRPDLAGRSYEALSVSTIAHPRNPYAPTSHCNLRFFRVEAEDGGAATWWFGGGFDLTPYYGFQEDAQAWHRAAREACLVLGDDEKQGDAIYQQMKSTCDDYFFLPHRQEARGIGGIFFDDLAQPSFRRVFAFVRAVGDAFLDSYVAILNRRAEHPYGDDERAFQLFRRGRYVEFNLLHDRGTRFGLQSGGAVESILASLPPEVHWRHDYVPEPDSAEAALYRDFLPPRNWLASSD